MAEALNEVLYLHRDQRLVLDDDDIGSDLGRDILVGVIEKLGDVGKAHLENFRGIGERELLHRHEHERLPPHRRHGREIAIDRRDVAIGRDGRPLLERVHLREDEAIERDARRETARVAGENVFQCLDDAGITKLLASGESARKSAQKGHIAH